MLKKCIILSSILCLVLATLIPVDASCNKPSDNNSTFCSTNHVSLYVTPFSIEDGLRQSMVSQVIKDSDGLIWLLTGDGLHCFNGFDFRQFTIPFKGNYNHSDNMMRKIIESSPGKFIISTSSALVSFDKQNGKFTFIDREPMVYTVLFDALLNGKAFVWKANSGLMMVENNKLVPLKLNYTGKSLPPPNTVFFQAVKFKNKIVVISEDGILTITDTDADSHTLSSRWIKSSGCKAISKNAEDAVFILKNSGIYRLVNEQLIKVFSLNVNTDNEFLIDHKGRFWFADKCQKLIYCLTKGSLQEVHLLSHLQNGNDTLKPSIKCFFEDNMKNLWFGTDGNGLLKYDPDKIIFDKALTGFIRCIIPFENGILAGTYGSGMWKLSKDLAVSKKFSPELFKDDGYILDLTTDKFNHIWVVSRTGIKVVTPSGRLMYDYQVTNIHSKIVLNNGECIKVLIDGVLYSFKLSTSGLPDLISKKKHSSINTGLYYNGRSWFATSIGLYTSRSSGWNLDKENITKDAVKLTDIQIHDLIAINNEVWAASDMGVLIFSSNGKPIELPTYLVELSDEVIYSLLRDKSGRLWFSGLRGIGCINLESKTIRRFTKENNLQSMEFNQNASCLGTDGRLYFGGIMGINCIDPNAIHKLTFDPGIGLYNLFVSDTAYSQGIPSEVPILFVHRNSPNFSGSVFNKSHRNATCGYYSFYLTGLDHEWGKPSQNTHFSYGNLPPGEYKLYSRFIDSWNNYGKPQLLLIVKIRPAFWDTWLFRISALVLIVIITILLVRKVQSIQYKSRIRVLEQAQMIERERLRISKDMHDEVGASLTRISILSELAKKQKNEPEKYSVLIDQISEISGGVIDELSEIIWAINPGNDTLDRFAAHIRHYATSFLENCIDNIKFDFPGEIPSYPMSAELRRNLFLIVKEALNNIVKHSKATNVRLKLSFEDSILIMEIIDDGVGIRESNKAGNGLVNMNKRIEECGGNLKLISDANQGTQLLISLELGEYNITQKSDLR